MHEPHRMADRTVTHACWALSTVDLDWHDRIASEPDRQAASHLGHHAPRHDGWSQIRLAVVAHAAARQSTGSTRSSSATS
jgi:hypothetical protein